MSKVPIIRFSQFNKKWEHKKLENILMVNPKNGYSSQGVNYETKYKNLTLSAVTSGYFSCYKYIDLDIEDDSYLWVKKGDILLQRANSLEYVGSCAIYEGENNQYVYPDLLMKLLVDKLYNNNFIYYYLSSPKTRKYYRDNAIGTSGNMPKINQTIVNNTPICLPIREEQDKITEFLSVIDLMIQKQSSIIKEYREIWNGFMQKIFTQNIRFKNEYGETYPEWKEYHLKDILKERKTYSEKDSGYPHVTLPKHGIYDKGDRYDRDFLVTTVNKKYKITHINDICYNPANLKFGVICRNDYGNAIFSPIYITFEVKSDFNPVFLSYYLSRWDFINSVLKYEQGTVFERMSVSPDDFLKYRNLLPGIEEQNKIASFMEIFDEKIKVENTILQDWLDIRKGLLQQMFI